MLKPYYQNELTTLYHGDCLDVMDYLIEKGIKVDCVLTDPPYGINYQCGFRKIKYDKLKNDNNINFLSAFIEKAYQILNENTPILIFCSWHNVDVFKKEIQKHFSIKNMLIWYKDGGSMGDLKGAFMFNYEIIFYAVKGQFKLNGKRESDIIKIKKVGVNNYHPTQKPLSLIEYLLIKTTNKNDLIFDGFAGSGTTLVASDRLGRRCIGIELDKKHCDTTVKRLRTMQLKMDI